MNMKDIKQAFLIWLGFAIVVILLCFIMPSADSSSSGQTKTAKCQVCGTEYSLGTSDSKSIRDTNMCVRCFKNYGAAQKSLGRDVLGNPIK